MPAQTDPPGEPHDQVRYRPGRPHRHVRRRFGQAGREASQGCRRRHAEGPAGARADAGQRAQGDQVRHPGHVGRCREESSQRSGCRSHAAQGLRRYGRGAAAGGAGAPQGAAAAGRPGRRPARDAGQGRAGRHREDGGHVLQDRRQGRAGRGCAAAGTVGTGAEVDEARGHRHRRRRHADHRTVDGAGPECLAPGPRHQPARHAGADGQLQRHGQWRAHWHERCAQRHTCAGQGQRGTQDHFGAQPPRPRHAPFAAGRRVVAGSRAVSVRGLSASPARACR